MSGTIAADRAFLASYMGDIRQAVAFAQQALEDLPDNEPLPQSMRSVANLILGEAAWLDGDLQRAGQIYTEAIQISRAAGDIPMLINNNANLADILLEQGKLHQAERLYSETLQVALRPDGRRLPSVAHVYAKLSSLSYEWNDLAAAARYARQCIEICQIWGNAGLQAEACILLSRAEHAQGNLESAQNAIRSAEQLTGECRLSPRQTSALKCSLARQWLARGNLERAADILQKCGLSPASFQDAVEIPYLREPEALLLLRLLWLRNEYEAALALSRRLLQKPEADGRTGTVIQVLALQALIFQAKKDPSQALAALEKALSLAQPEGYRRVFLDEGRPMARLLALLKSQQVGAGYAAELLALIPKDQAEDQPPAQIADRAAQPTRAGSAEADRSRKFKPGNRRKIVHFNSNGQASYQQYLRQAGGKEPDPGSRPGQRAEPAG